MKQLSRKSTYIASLIISIGCTAHADQINLNQLLIQALELKGPEILEKLELTGLGHTILSTGYDNSQGYGAGNIRYPSGYQLVPTPAATFESWASICSPSTGRIDNSSVQEVQEGSTYANTNTTDASIVITVDAKVNYGAASLDLNTVTRFDSSQTTTTTKTLENIKSVTISLFSEALFSCDQSGPFFMHASDSVSNNLTQTLAGDTNVPYEYDVYPNGDVFSVATKAPFVTNTVPGANVRVVMWNRKGDQVWDSTNAADPSGQNNYQWYDANSDFPNKQDIQRVLVSTGANYGVTANVWICKTNDNCLKMDKEDNFIPKNSEYSNGNINSIIVQNRDTMTTETGGELTTHSMNISDFLGLDYTITKMSGIYTAQAIDYLTTNSSLNIYQYVDINIVPESNRLQCGATIEEAQAAYRSIC